MEKMILSAKLLLISAVFLGLNGCITTSLNTHSNPKFKEAKFQKVGVFAPSLSGKARSEMEDKLVENLTAQEINAVPFHDLFPPYKTWSAGDIKEKLQEENIRAALSVRIGKSEGSRQTVGFQTYSSGSAQSTGTGTVNAQSQSTTVPVVSANRTTYSRAILIEVPSEKRVWVADGVTEGSGTLYDSLEDAIGDLSHKYANALADSGLMARR